MLSKTKRTNSQRQTESGLTVTIRINRPQPFWKRQSSLTGGKMNRSMNEIISFIDLHGRWGNTDDYASILFQLSLSSAALRKSKPYSYPLFDAQVLRSCKQSSRSSIDLYTEPSKGGSWCRSWSSWKVLALECASLKTKSNRARCRSLQYRNKKTLMSLLDLRKHRTEPGEGPYSTETQPLMSLLGL